MFQKDVDCVAAPQLMVIYLNISFKIILISGIL